MTRAVIEKRGNLWHVVVLYDDHKVAVVGRYPARYKAEEHAQRINETGGVPQSGTADPSGSESINGGAVTE